MSVSAYKRTVRNSESPRDIERQIFSRITNALATYAETYDSAETDAQRAAVLGGSLQSSLAENSRLWAALKMDLMHADNALPAALRGQLISMALFVERATTEVVKRRGRVATLVEINRAVIGGLSGLSPSEVA